MGIFGRSATTRLLALVSTIVAGLMPVPQALAASCTWIPSTGNWATAGDWSCSAVPGSADSVTIGLLTQTVTVNTAQSVLNLTNAGNVDLNAFTLTLVGGGTTTNTGIINVGAGPIPNNAALDVSAGHNVNNTGGVINISADSVLNQFGSTISDGTIATTGTGAVAVFSSGNNFLSGVTLNGTLDLTSIANAREQIINGATLNGTVNIANGGILGLNSASTTGGNQTISGTGTINLNDAAAHLSIEGNGSTTLASGITVRGQGNIGAASFVGGTNTLINNGLISADVNGGTLIIAPPANAGSLVNNATLQATGGGTLQLSTNTNNAGGTISAQNGSVVVQNGVKISGGALTTSGTGAIQASSSGVNFLDGVNLTGTLNLTSIANSREQIINGATINGVVNVANGGILSLNSASTSGGNQTLSGTAVINLNDAAARLSIEGNGSTTLGSDITVRGQGNIGTPAFVGGVNTLTNNGLISSDVTGGTLNITAPGNAGSFINNGTLQAVNGGTLLLSTNIVANAGSQIISGAGSAVVQNGVTINGIFTSSGGGFTATSSGSNFLNGVSFTGNLDLTSIANSREQIINGATINGAVNVANGGILSLNSAITTGHIQTLAGNVTINLNDAGARLSIDGSGSTTLASGVTVRGQGNIGTPAFVGGVNTLTNNGLISADVAGGTLAIEPPANAGSFINNTTLQAINGATLLLSTSINNAGQIVAGAGSTVKQNGVTLNGVIDASAAGASLVVTSSGSNFLNGVNFSGKMDLTSIANSLEQIINGATINGAINVANGGILSLNSASTSGGNQTLSGTAIINLNDANARLSIDGNGSTTLGSDITVRGQGNIGTPAFVGGVNTLTNNGLISADVNGATLSITTPANSGSFINNATVQAVNGATLLLSSNINNASGLISAQNGSTVVQNGVTISGGTLATSGSGAVKVSGSGINVLDGVNFSGTMDMTSIANSREEIINGATINGAINVANGGILSLNSASSTNPNQTIGGTGVINLNDAGARLSIDGTGSTTLAAGLTVRGQGNIGTPVAVGGTNTLFNNGTILADGATLTITAPANNGTLAGTGTLRTSGGTLNLNTGSASTQGMLVMGGAGSALNLNNQNLTITSDYTNAQFGSGNTFNSRAGVTGTGQILAGANAAQVITGAGVTNGATSNATLTLGNVRVGTATFDYQIANAGTTGPSLRGAIQTNVNGANISDSRLSGTGVTAGNYDTGAPGSSTGDLAVTFTAASAGALAPLSGQLINLTSNFANISNQKLNIVFGSGTSAYNAAVGNASSPVQIANQRVGGASTAIVTVANTAAAGAFSEDLNASVGATSGAAFGSGAILGRLAGTNNTGSGAISVGVNTTSAGAQTGTVTLNYQTAGAVNGVSNGLGTASAGSQGVTVNGNVYLAAAGAIQTAALNFGTVQVGQSVSQNLVIRNTATGPAGFVEDLNASFGSTSGTGASLIGGTGSLNGIVAGSNSTAANGAMTVSVNTASAGTVSGGIAVNYFTAGAVGGLSNGLGTAAVGSDNYGVAGTIQTQVQVINQASPLINNPLINLGAVRVGDAAPTALLSVTNQATVAPQAALNASIASNGAPVTASGSFNLLLPGSTNASQLQVGLNTATAGNFTGANAGSATVSFVSDASNVGGCAPNCQLTLASQQVGVSGKVYSPAVAQLNTPSINFGIVHVGDTVTPQGVSVTNAAPTTALNDVLTGSFAAATGPFTASGTLLGVAAQSSNATSFQAGLNTTNSGLFNGTATATFASHNGDMSDLALGSTPVALTGQVNNFAQVAIAKTGGSGSLSHVGNTYTLNLGTLLLGAPDATGILEVLNGASGLADLLSGSFDTSGVGSAFTLAGFTSFSGLAAGVGQGGLDVTLDSATAGVFDNVITLHTSGSNASGYQAALADTTLVLRGDVVTAAVPEPGTYALMLAGLLLMAGAVRSRRHPHFQRAA